MQGDLVTAEPRGANVDRPAGGVCRTHGILAITGADANDEGAMGSASRAARQSIDDRRELHRKEGVEVVGRVARGANGRVVLLNGDVDLRRVHTEISAGELFEVIPIDRRERDASQCAWALPLRGVIGGRIDLHAISRHALWRRGARAVELLGAVVTDCPAEDRHAPIISASAADPSTFSRVCVHHQLKCGEANTISEPLGWPI